MTNTTTISHFEEDTLKQQPSGMKFSLQRDELFNALTSVMESVDTRSALPILRHLLIEARPSQVVFTGSDLQTAISLTIPARVEQTGTCIVGASALMSHVKKIPRGREVSLIAYASEIVVEYGNRTYPIKGGRDASQFPDLWPEMVLTNGPTIASDLLGEAIREVHFAAGDGSGRPVFESIRMWMQETCASLMAADSGWMAERTIPMIDHVGKRDTTLLLPVESMRRLSRVLTGNEAVKILWNSERAVFEVGPLRFATRLVIGIFPTPEFPTSYQTTLKLERADLLHVLQGNWDKLSISYRAPGSVMLSASSRTLDEANHEVEACIEGSDGTIILNAAFLAVLLECVQAETFTFAIERYGIPCLIAPTGRNNYQCAIMPVG